MTRWKSGGDGSDPQTEDAMESNFCNRSDADFKWNVCSFLLKQNESYGYIAGIRQIFRLAMAFSVMILVCYMDYSWIGKHARLFGRQLSVVYGSDETFFCPSD